MISAAQITSSLNNCIESTDFLCIPGKRKGKVRDTYDLGKDMLIVTTDRLSAFDRVIAAIPFKGQVLNQISAFWFEKTRDIVPNHLIALPDPNVALAKKCMVIPIEMVVRGYLTGSTDTSAWTLYSRGVRNICGNAIPDGMAKNQKFDCPILTPTTKSDVHDESISAQEIVSRGILDKTQWAEISRIAFALFKRGSEIAQRNGLILVDTKYEFGLDQNGSVCLIDEIHTPDSSRYWIANTYKERFDRGEEPENIDKEFIRLWFREHCDPYKDTVLPAAPVELVVELSRRYIQLYEMITGTSFVVNTNEDIQKRMRTNIDKAGIHA